MGWSGERLYILQSLDLYKSKLEGKFGLYLICRKNDRKPIYIGKAEETDLYDRLKAHLTGDNETECMQEQMRNNEDKMELSFYYRIIENKKEIAGREAYLIKKYFDILCNIQQPTDTPITTELPPMVALPLLKLPFEEC